MNKTIIQLILLTILTFCVKLNGQEVLDILDTTDCFYLTSVEDNQVDSIWLMDVFNDKASTDYESIQIEDLENSHDFFIFGKLMTGHLENPAILIKADNPNFKLYLDGHLIFDCAEKESEDNRFLDYFIIPVDTFSFVKILAFHCYYDGIFGLGEVSITKIGEIEELYKMALQDQKNFTKSSLLAFGIGSALILLGLFLLILFFFFKRETGLLLLFFSIFTFGVGADQFSPFISYYYSIPSDVATRLITIWVSLIAIGLWGLIHTISGKALYALSGIMVSVNALIMVIGQFFLLEYLLIFEYITIAQIILAIIIMIKYKLFKNKEYRFFAYSTSLYLLLIIFYTYIPEDSDFSSVGALVVVLSLGMLSFNRYKQEKLKVNVFSKEIKTIKEQLNQLEVKNIQAQLEALKNQLNPHFLFNSLYALSALIKSDQEKATKFVEEFSDIFRYVLESSERTVVKIEKELNFIQSYIYLQKIRYLDNLQICIDIPEKEFNYYIPPLSLQLLVENAIKHNEISDDFPLIIEIFVEDDSLVVKNGIKKLEDLPESKKVGLENLKAQYNLITNRNPEFEQKDGFFIVKIPLIIEED